MVEVGDVWQIRVSLEHTQLRQRSSPLFATDDFEIRVALFNSDGQQVCASSQVLRQEWQQRPDRFIATAIEQVCIPAMQRLVDQLKDAYTEAVLAGRMR